MQPATSMKPIGGQRVEPAVSQDTTDQNPTQTRYGWNPYKDINLVGPDGTMSLYVQPHEIMFEGRAVPNPYHRIIPKGQLIPFPTFTALEYTLSEDLKDSKGASMPVQTPRSITALAAITSVMRVYSGQGFTMLRALQGLDQDTADRIFRVVHPFEYRMGSLAFELEAGAEARITSIGDLVFTLDDGNYVVPALRSEQEREIARELAAEMSAGATIAVTLAEQIFSDTDISIRTRLAGGQGKVAPDNHDKYVAAELGVKFAQTDALGVPDELTQNVKFLVDREVDRSKDEEIARLKAELAEKDGGITETRIRSTEEVSTLQSANVGYCGRPTTAGGQCKALTKDGAACFQHADKEDEEEEEAIAA